MTDDGGVVSPGHATTESAGSLMHSVYARVKRYMPEPLRAWVRRLRSRGPVLNPDKLALIDYCFRRFTVRSFADLGGVWHVEAGYTFYGLDRYPIERAMLIDDGYTATVLERAKRYRQLMPIEGNFGNAQVAEKIGNVDAILMYDILLHQVAPDWDAILAMYAPRTRCFLIYNQQFLEPRTVRLLELGEERYFREVPHSRNEEWYRSVFENLDGIEPTSGRRYRDLHWIWQWGITDDDLIATMRRLGFRLHYFQNCGRFDDLPNFENHAFVFARSGAQSVPPRG